MQKKSEKVKKSAGNHKKPETLAPKPRKLTKQELQAAKREVELWDAECRGPWAWLAEAEVEAQLEADVQRAIQLSNPDGPADDLPPDWVADHIWYCIHLHPSR